jgi:hypothetical protein
LNGTVDRSPVPVATGVGPGGNYVAADTWYTAAELGLQPGQTSLTLYVEGVAPSAASGDLKITANVNINGGTTLNTAATDSVVVTVVKLTLSEIDYNGPNNVNITMNATQDIGVPKGAPGGGGTGDIEWVNGLRDQPDVANAAWVSTQAAPAAFTEGNPIEATVYFSVAPAGILSNITIAATGNGTPYGNIANTTLSLTGGMFQGTVQTTGSDPNVDVNNVTFNWTLSSMQTSSGQDITLPENIQKTTNRIYTLYDAPTGSLASEPWASVLELAIGIVKQYAPGGVPTPLGANPGDDSTIVGQLTTGIYSSLWKNLGTSAYFINPTATLTYRPNKHFTEITGPTGGAAASDFESQQYNLTGFLASLAGTSTWQQCNDDSNLLAILADSLGIDAQPLWFATTWPVVTWSTDALAPTSYYGAGEKTITRPGIRFRFHQIVYYDGWVYDPSTSLVSGGPPTMGMTFTNYVKGSFKTQASFGTGTPIQEDVTKITVK